MKVIVAFLLGLAFLASALLVWNIELAGGFRMDRSGKAIVAMVGFGTILLVYSSRSLTK